MELNKMKTLADTVAAVYRRRCKWVDMDELRQVALLAICEALRTWDPTVGVSAGAYCYRAAYICVGREVWKASAPVSAHASELRHLAAVTKVSAAKAERIPSTRSQADVSLEALQERARCVRFFTELFAALPDGEIARRVLLSDEPLRRTITQLVAEEAATRRQINSAVTRARKRIAGSATCYALWNGE